ncbi:MAG: hypothetical protein AAGA59_12220 [Actinomycetota bacterium]
MGAQPAVIPLRSVISRLGRSMLALALLTALLTLVSASPAAAAGTHTVNNVGDDGDQTPGDGVCRTAGGVCTLRAAVDEANSSAGPDTINFNIAGGGPHIITINSTLTIRDRSGGTTIDGYSQPGASVNTSPDAFNATIPIHVNGTSGAAPMLRFTTAANTVSGLSIYGGVHRIWLDGENADGNRFLGNIIGTDPTGDVISGSGHGVYMRLGPDRNVIGTSALEDRNVISGSGNWGFRIDHGETSQNIIQNNIIGLSPDLTKNPRQGGGIDLQWYTWGNYIADNLISGHRGQAVDLSHSAPGNVVINNRMGTTADGNAADAVTANGRGMTVKDNARNNWVVDNVMAGNRSDGIWHKHNYTLGNNFLNNRIGVGLNGNVIGNGGWGVRLTGQDDLYLGNVFAANAATAFYVDSSLGSGPNFPSVPSAGNSFLENTYYGSPYPLIDIDGGGQNPNDPGDADTGTHGRLNHPEITGIGPGQIFGTACAGCTVEVYVSGVIAADGTLNTDTADVGEGAGWIGRVVADGGGNWSLGSGQLRADKLVTLIATDPAGSSSETSPPATVPTSFVGAGSNPGASLGRTPVPAPPGPPPAFVPDIFTCAWSNGTLTWDDDGASQYFVRTVDANGIETYFGGFTGTSASVPNADGYRVVNWSQGFARSAVCDGPGDAPTGEVFVCSFANGILSWTDEGAGTYYVRTVDAAGDDSYFAAASGTSLNVPDASGYQVIHWSGGTRFAASCDGPGEAAAFTCSYANGTLSWTDQNVSTYFVRLVDGAGADSFFASTTGTSLNVPASAGYQVIHWVGGKNTAAC